jgi:hypothetical protein
MEMGNVACARCAGTWGGGRGGRGWGQNVLGVEKQRETKEKQKRNKEKQKRNKRETKEKQKRNKEKQVHVDVLRKRGGF